MRIIYSTSAALLISPLFFCLGKLEYPDKLSGKYTIYGKYSAVASELARVFSISENVAQLMFYGMFMETDKKILPNIRKPKNSDRREREYLTEHEIDKIIREAKKVGRHGNRDSTMILLAYRHGLRVSELIRLKWSQVDLYEGLLHVTRMKNGIQSTHPLAGIEIRGEHKNPGGIYFRTII